MDPYRVLVVDDDADVHSITELALKHKTWRGRRFSLDHAHSSAQARDLLSQKPEGYFDVAIVDVVMESESAGLELCEHIRAKFPRSLRIILRTGQAGVAPEERVLNDYDIDTYLAKTEATEARLANAVRSCLRGSSDIRTLIEVKESLGRLANELSRAKNTAELAHGMAPSLAFLQQKYDMRIGFVGDAGNEKTLVCAQASDVSLFSHRLTELKRAELSPSPQRAHTGGFGALTVTTASVAKPSLSFFDKLAGRTKEGAEIIVTSGFMFSGEKVEKEFWGDLEILLRNWQTTLETFFLQERLVQIRVQRERTATSAYSAMRPGVVAQAAAAATEKLLVYVRGPSQQRGAGLHTLNSVSTAAADVSSKHIWRFTAWGQVQQSGNHKVCLGMVVSGQKLQESFDGPGAWWLESLLTIGGGSLNITTRFSLGTDVRLCAQTLPFGGGALAVSTQAELGVADGAIEQHGMLLEGVG